MLKFLWDIINNYPLVWPVLIPLILFLLFFYIMYSKFRLFLLIAFFSITASWLYFLPTEYFAFFLRLFFVFLLLLLVAYFFYHAGLSEGENKGYDEGHEQGYKYGYDEGKHASQVQYFNEGYEQGIKDSESNEKDFLESVFLEFSDIGHRIKAFKKPMKSRIKYLSQK